MDLITILSFAVSIVSIVLAIVAMFSAKATERGSQENFEKTQKTMHDIYDKTKDALAQIDKKAEIIDNVVQRSQEQLINTVTNILNETIIPKKPDAGEEFGVRFLNSLFENPSTANENMKMLMSLANEVEKSKKNQNPK